MTLFWFDNIVLSAGRVLWARSFIVSFSWSLSSLYWTPCLGSFFGGCIFIYFFTAKLALSFYIHSCWKHDNLWTHFRFFCLQVVFWEGAEEEEEARVWYRQERPWAHLWTDIGLVADSLLRCTQSRSVQSNSSCVMRLSMCFSGWAFSSLLSFLQCRFANSCYYSTLKW